MRQILTRFNSLKIRSVLGCLFACPLSRDKDHIKTRCAGKFDPLAAIFLAYGKPYLQGQVCKG